jgi:hypothetical protein
MKPDDKQHAKCIDYSSTSQTKLVPVLKIRAGNPNRHPAGSSQGGEFAPKGGGGDTGVADHEAVL